jgi:hypothetical protein
MLGSVVRLRSAVANTPKRKPAISSGFRTWGNWRERVLSLDKLGVTGSSPVPPTHEAPGNGGFLFPRWKRRSLDDGAWQPLGNPSRSGTADAASAQQYTDRHSNASGDCVQSAKKPWRHLIDSGGSPNPYAEAERGEQRPPPADEEPDDHADKGDDHPNHPSDHGSGWSFQQRTRLSACGTPRAQLCDALDSCSSV